jgi:hypothetical protein
VVIAQFDNPLYRTLHRGNGVIQDRRAVGHSVERLTGQLAARDLGRFEEGEGDILLTLAKQSANRPVPLTAAMCARVSFDPNYHQRWR